MNKERVTLPISIHPEHKQAILDFCEENGLTQSVETRNMWFDRIGKPEFKQDYRNGRPKGER